MPDTRIIFVNRVYWPSTLATAQLLTDLAEGLASRSWSVHVIAAGEASTRQKGVTIHRTGTAEKQGGLVARALSHRRFLRAARWKLATLVRPGDLVVPMTDPPLLVVAVARNVRVRCRDVVNVPQPNRAVGSRSHDLPARIGAIHRAPTCADPGGCNDRTSA